MVGFVSETVYLSRSFNNAASPPQWKSFEGWNRRAWLITPTSISPSLSFHSFLIRPLFVFFFPPFSPLVSRDSFLLLDTSFPPRLVLRAWNVLARDVSFRFSKVPCEVSNDRRLDRSFHLTLLLSLFLSLCERTCLGFFSREIRRCSLSFILTLLFYRRITDWISSRRGIGLQRGLHEDGMENFSGKRGNKLKTQVGGWKWRLRFFL